ncbi:MAG: TolC family protein [Chloroflexi bacterium]|nr:TolC family protein [Chloroflexota bacterium]
MKKNFLPIIIAIALFFFSSYFAFGEVKTENQSNNLPSGTGEKASPGASCIKETPLKAGNTVFDEINIDDLRKSIESQEVDRPGHSDSDELVPGRVLTARDGVRLALARNIQLKQVKDEIDRAAAKYRLARSYKLPQFSLAAAEIYMKPTQEMYLPPPIDQTVEFPKQYMTVGQAALQYLITTFGNVENQIAAAFVNIDAAEENYESYKRQLIFNVKENFFNIFKARSMVIVAADYVGTSKDNLRVAKSLRNNGMVSQYDVLRAELSVSEAEQELVSAKKAFILSHSSFLYILDYSEKIPFGVAPGKMHFLPGEMTLVRLQEIALKNRHEIKAIAKNLESSQLLLNAARSQNNPSVSLYSGYSRETKTPIIPEYFFTVTLIVNIKIADGGEKAANVEDAATVIHQTELAFEDLKKKICLEVEQAYLDLKEAEVRYLTALQDEKTNEESYRIAKVRYENGLAIAIEMEDSLRSLNQAKQKKVIQQNNYLVAMAALEKSIGRDFLETELLTYSDH